jgi:translation initiation factor 2 alpha subunit (eIF-2alpha)
MSDYLDNEFTELYQSIEDIIDLNIDVLNEEQLKKLYAMLETVADINLELNDSEE